MQLPRGEGLVLRLPELGNSLLPIMAETGNGESTMETLEGRLAALESSRQADQARLAALEAELVELRSAKQTAERRLRRLHWWRGAAGILLVAGLLIGPPGSLQAQGTPEQRVGVLEGKLARVFVVNNGADLVISGANLHIANGLGGTQTNNGLGNLVIGYNEPRGGGQDVRTGSHNLVLGQLNNFSSFGGIVGGVQNTSSGPFASIVTGFNNQATAFYAFCATGRDNIPSANYASVTGGQGNAASGLLSSISGGASNAASGATSWVGGGNFNTAFGQLSSVSGGQENAATNTYASVNGGFANQAGGSWSTVSGGAFRSVAGPDDWRAGTLFEDD
jgi:hypothetical protein